MRNPIFRSPRAENGVVTLILGFLGAGGGILLRASILKAHPLNGQALAACLEVISARYLGPPPATISTIECVIGRGKN